MNLYEPLPESVNVNGKTYRIQTDFRLWLKLMDMAKADEIIRFADFYSGAFPTDPEQAQAGMLQFFKMEDDKQHDDGSKNEGAERRKRNVISFNLDAPFIASAFLQCYGIDLYDSKTRLHWWKFRMLLDGLPSETEIKKRIMYRSMDASKIKNKAERERVRKIQREIALPQEVLSDYEIGNAF